MDPISIAVAAATVFFSYKFLGSKPAEDSVEYISTVIEGLTDDAKTDTLVGSVKNYSRKKKVLKRINIDFNLLTDKERKDFLENGKVPYHLIGVEVRDSTEE